MTDQFSMTDLGEALRGPDGPKKRKEVLATLEALKAKVDSSIKEGAPPAEFEKQQKISRAVQTSIDALTAYTK
jgi:hypothetical protein